MHHLFRIDAQGNQLGFTAPPCTVHIKFLPLGTGWILVVLTPPARPPAAARWLATFEPISIHIAPGISPKLLRATFDPVPDPWISFLRAVDVQHMELTPDGSASLFIADAPEKVKTFLTTLRSNEPGARSRPVQTNTARVPLTPRQIEIVSLAVALGYYEVPHKVYLRTVAKKAGLSIGAVAELLRRGEALIISTYVDAMSQAEWRDARTPRASKSVFTHTFGPAGIPDASRMGIENPRGHGS